jgi:putative acyl-CoA dehydrogenase
MVAHTRLDCVTGSTAGMRAGVAAATWHAAHRSAFGKPLIQQPAMRNVLADLALEYEAATALAMRVARAIDATPRDPAEAAFARVATAVGKYWVCKRATAFVNEAQECLGGAGYVEESPLPRLYRQAPLNSIWEGSGNIQCLDVLRALHREPECRAALFAQVEDARRFDVRLDGHVAALHRDLDGGDVLEADARRLVERLALALQAATLYRADAGLAEAFVTARIAEGHGHAYGTLGGGAPVARLLERAFSA